MTNIHGATSVGRPQNAFRVFQNEHLLCHERVLLQVLGTK